QPVGDHWKGEGSNAGDVHVKRRLRIIDHIHDALHDVHRLISHSLQVGINLDAGDDEAEINRHRLLHGEQVYREFIDFPLNRIDFWLVAQDELAHTHITVLKGADRALHSLLSQAAHGKKFLFEIVKSLVKTCARHPNLPVM